MQKNSVSSIINVVTTYNEAQMVLEKKIIGIPRALSYYNYYPFLYGFYSDLGFEVVTSEQTTKKTISDGAAVVVSETCLPVKVYLGHVKNLLAKGVKNIFIPSIQSIAPKIYNCSKIRGLPDLIRNVIKEDFNMIEATLDKSEKNLGLFEFLEQCVEPFGITDEKEIKRALRAGFVLHNNFRVMMQHNLDFEQALKNAKEGKVVISLNNESKMPIGIAIIAHGYNIYDTRVCMDVFKKLKDLNVKVYNANMLTDEDLNDGVSTLESEVYWANQLEMTGAAGHYLKNDKVDGIVTITAFGCGPDSLMIEDMKRKTSKNFNKPMLNLTIDEHTGEAGFVTRLEAFCDMLIRKKRSKLHKKRDDFGKKMAKQMESENAPNEIEIESEKSDKLVLST